MRDNLTAAKLLNGNAWAFWKSAKLLLADSPDLVPWGVCFVNISFAIELGLKAYLRAQGWTEEKQRKLCHDLVSAFDKAEAAGFQSHHPLARLLAQDLSPHHQDMSLRYLTGEGEGMTLPPLSPAIDNTELLLRELYAQGIAMAESKSAST